MISQKDKLHLNKLSSKTKVDIHGPKHQSSILDYMDIKFNKKKIQDSFNKKVVSQTNLKLENQNQFGPSTQIQSTDIDIEMKNESGNMNSSLKDSLNSEQMNMSNEEKSKLHNDSLNNIESSYGDNYSTANSFGENKQINNLLKEKNENTTEEKMHPNNEMNISKENEFTKNSDLQSAHEYIDEIFENLIEEEKVCNSEINPNYFEYQIEINQTMRSILIDWLIDVHYKFKFNEETFYITIYIIDSYLSKRIIQRNKFQLLGISSLFIASKLNEIYVRRIDDYVFITDNAYTVEDIKYMEEDIAKILNFNFLVPSALSFYQIITKKFRISEYLNKYQFGKFLIQSFLMDYRSLFYSYSTIACACCYIVMKFYKIKNYQICYDNKYYSIKRNNNYDNKNGYEIKECAQSICSVISELFNSNQQSTIMKYSIYQFVEDIKKIVLPLKK